MKHYVICFDIQDDRVRARLSRLLEKWGQRVQGSVFECSFKSPERKQQLQRQILKIIEQSEYEESNIRFYNLSKETIKYCHDIHNQPIAQLPAAVVL